MRMKLLTRILITLITSLFCTSDSMSTVIYVRTGGGDTYDGSSWASAKRTIGAAIDAGSSGDDVWVAAGTYTELVKMKSGVSLYGAFPANGGDWNARDYAANVTIIDGNAQGSVVKAPYEAGRETRIDGFTIRNGKSDVGGGIYCYNANITITNNRISQNIASGYNGYGGGICLEYSSPVIDSNTINNNTASTGASIYCAQDSHPVIANNVISGSSGTKGGGIYMADGSNPTISNNAISGAGSAIYCEWYSSPNIRSNRIINNATPVGSGIYCFQSSPTLTNNIVAKNSSTSGGAGLWCTEAAPLIINNTIVDNAPSPYGGGIALQDAQANIRNNIISYNFMGIYQAPGSIASPTLSNNCVYSNGAHNYYGISAGITDISVNPLIVNKTAGDYHIDTKSPCINRGLNSAPSLPSNDFDGQARIWAGTVDIGADEFLASPVGFMSVKGQPDGTWIALDSSVVTALFSNYFYVESESRANGLRIYYPGYDLTEGKRVVVTGIMRTNYDKERYLHAATVDVVGQ